MVRERLLFRVVQIIAVGVSLYSQHVGKCSTEPTKVYTIPPAVQVLIIMPTDLATNTSTIITEQVSTVCVPSIL